MAPGKIDPDYSDLNKSGVNFTMSKKLGGKRYTCGSTKSLGFVKKKKKVSLDKMSRQKLINSDTVVSSRGKNTD